MKKLFFLLKLVVKPNFQHRLRTVAVLLGIAVSVSLVIWNLRSFALTGSQIAAARQQQGRFDAVIQPKNFQEMRLSPRIVNAIRDDDAVAEVDAAVKSRVRMINPPALPMMGPFGGVTAIGTGAGIPPQKLRGGRWLDEADDEAVVAQSFQRRYRLKIGDWIRIAGMGGELDLKIVGVVPGAMIPKGVRMMPPPHLADIFINPAAAEKLNGYADRPGLLCLVLRNPQSAAEFAQSWSDRLAKADPEATVRLLKVQEQDDMIGAEPGSMQQMLSANATVLAFLAAFFIIFVTLSSNVRERLRQFAILRALALSRGQLIIMVVMEAMILALAGWAIGLVLMKGLLIVGGSLAGRFEIFRSNMFSSLPLGGVIVLISLAASIAGSLAAAALPAWQAWRVDPVDILAGQRSQGGGKLRKSVIVAAVLMVAVNPIIIVMARHSEGLRSALSHFQGWGPPGFAAPLLGSVAMIVGLILLVPLGVIVAEKLFVLPVAFLLRLDPRFLRQQLSGNLRRTTGTTIALSVGLTLFITTLVWGYSMLVPFTPTEGLPRMQIAVMPAGLPPEAVNEVAATPGIVGNECLPMAVEQPRLTQTMLASPAFAHVDQQQQHLLVVGINPSRAFGGETPLFNLDFIEGGSADSARRLAEGRFCVVPDHFATQTGLGIGDSFSMEVPDTDDEVSYTIAGIASVPGWNWLTKFSDTRRRAGRALAMIFVDYERCRSDFRLERVNYFWANVRNDVSAAQLEKQLEPLALRHVGFTAKVPQAGRVEVGTQYVKVTDRKDVLSMLRRRADDVIWSLTWLPLITLAISSLAVFNAIVASIRSRFWQFGVLRGVGLTGGGLLRLILAESLMICGAACILSIVGGTALAWCGTRLCTLFFFFGGHTPPLVLPWMPLLGGMAMALGACFIAAIIPAALAASREPLAYIRGGPLDA